MLKQKALIIQVTARKKNILCAFFMGCMGLPPQLNGQVSLTVLTYTARYYKED